MLFIQAAAKCTWRVLTEASGAIGVLISLAGTVAETLGQKIVMSNWIWIGIGAALLFITACKIEMELIREKDSRKKPEPNMTLEEVVKRIRGKEDIFGPDKSESMEVKRALTRIEERALTGALTVFGVKGIRYVPCHGDIDAIGCRSPIPTDHWQSNTFDYITFIDDRNGSIIAKNRHEHEKNGTGYTYIWFDRNEIDVIWPLPRRNLVWRNLFRFNAIS